MYLRVYTRKNKKEKSVECSEFQQIKSSLKMGSEKSDRSESGNLISSTGVQKEKFCIDCAEQNQQTSMRVLKEEESKSRKNRVGPGDLIWGKVMSHPWWPGQIYDESLAPSPLGHAKKDGSVLVSFFGDDSYALLDHDQVIPFEPHFEEKSKMSKLQTFSVAVEEAIDELKRRAALGLTCFCLHPGNFRPTKIEGLYEVDVSGYEHGAIYSSKLIKNCRDGFQPHGMFSFVKQLATSPRSLLNIYGIINSAKVTAYRKAVFEENDETYDQAFDEFEKDDETSGQAFGVKASSSEYLAEFSQNGNQLQGTAGAQVEAAASNGPRVFVISTEIARLERNNSVTVAKPCVDIASERSGPAALHYKHKDKASVYRKLRRSEVSKTLDKSKRSQSLNVPNVITKEKLQNLKCPIIPFDASVIEEKEKESCKGEIKRKRMKWSPPNEQGQKGKFQKDATFDNLHEKSGGETGRTYCHKNRETCKKKKNNRVNDYGTPRNGGLLSDLLAFACDPFYGTELGNATGALTLLKQFRSNFYQKSCCPDEHETTNKKRTLLECQERMTRKEELRGLKSLRMTKKYDDQKLLTPQEGTDINIQSTLPVQSEMKSLPRELPKENSKCRSDVEEQASPKGNANNNSIVCEYPDVDASSAKVNIGGENCREVLSEVVCASSPVSSSIQYKYKVGSLDETVAAINRKYSMDEGWKSHYQQNLSAINSSNLSLQLSNLLQKCNDILGHRTSSATRVNSNE